MKNRVMISVLCICILLTASGCGTGTGGEVSPDGNREQAAITEDIDGNGTEELVFGQNDEPDSAWDGVVYDLYTISDGELVHVFSGGYYGVPYHK